MVSLKSEDPDDCKPPITPPTRVQDELKQWESRAFTFEMDHEPSGSSRSHGSRNNQLSRSDSSPANSQSGNANRDAELLAQFAAVANGAMDIDHGFPPVLVSGQYPSLGPTPGFYGNFFHNEGMVSGNQLPPLTSMDFPWPHMSPPPQQHSSLPYHPHQPGSAMASPSPTFVPSTYPVPPPPPPLETSTSRSSRGRSVSSAAEDMTEAERAAMSEEKRRRNTAASARFRIKKKQKTVNLERSVSDLTGRAEELEREVSDLRRENGWLKEIVMLKGTRFAAANLSHRMALNQAAALALGGQQSMSEGFSRVGGSEASGSNRNAEEFSEEESDSSDDEAVAAGKGKNKADSSGKRK